MHLNAESSWLKNLSIAKFDRFELAGSLGDMGTFLPLMLGLAYVTGLSFPAMLFWAGAFNFLTGLTFAIPMPVQPMKAIAAAAISEGLTAGEVYTAGIITGAVVFLIGALNLTQRLDNVVPRAVVRGIQLVIGLKLLVKGVEMVASRQWFGIDSIVTGAAGFLLVVLLLNSRRIPVALVIMSAGVIAAAFGNPEAFRAVSLSPYVPQFIGVSSADWFGGLVRGAVPQLPLTLLNSVVAVSALSFDLFPKRGAGTRKIAMSVGVMNAACVFGAMPMCHGAGGLAAQNRFGARTNGSILMLGAGKMLVALALGASVLPLIEAFPESLLGVMLSVAGIELGGVVRDQTGKRDFLIVLITAGVGLAVNSIAAGFVVGVIVAAALRKLCI